MKHLLTTTALATLVFAAPAYAGTSCYVGATVGYSVASADASLDVLPDAFGPGSPAIPGLIRAVRAVDGLRVDGLSAEGANGGFTAGCDYRVNRFLIGGWADYTWHGAEFKASIVGIPIAEVELERQWSIGGRIGSYVTDNTLIYGLIGYTRVSTSDLTGPGYAFGISDLDGVVYGGGLEVDVGSGVTIGAEYRYTDLEDRDVAIIPDALNLNLDTSIHTARVVAKYRFDFR